MLTQAFHHPGRNTAPERGKAKERERMSEAGCGILTKEVSGLLRGGRVRGPQHRTKRSNKGTFHEGQGGIGHMPRQEEWDEHTGLGVKLGRQDRAGRQAGRQ